jgi:hypothetical protein
VLWRPTDRLSLRLNLFFQDNKELGSP